MPNLFKTSITIMARTSTSATKKILWIIGGLLILIVILGVVGRVTGVFGGGNDAVKVETSEAQLRNITQVVTASGKIQPETEVTISPDVSGEIIELTIKEGDYVERGVLLVRIKPDFYLTQVEQAQAGVLQAKANLAQRKADMMTAESDLRRQKELFGKDAISESELERAQTTYDVGKAAYEGAQYAVQSAEARLREAQEQVSKTAIYSPMAGTVSKLDVELGERVVGTSQMAGTEMMRVARLDQMEVEADVNENEIVNVALGDTTAIEVDAYPDRPFHGVVTEIANSARTTGAGTQEQVTNFPVKVRILDTHNLDSIYATDPSFQAEEVPVPEQTAARLRPGMSATVDIFTETVFDVVAVPIQSVTVRDFNKTPPKDLEGADSTEVHSDADADVDSDKDGDDSLEGQEEDIRKVVFTVEDGKARMIEVTTGISDDTHVEVRRGLVAGETVVTGPYRVVSRSLKPGDEVDSRREDEASLPFVASRN